MSKPYCLFETISDRFNFGKYNNLSLSDVLDINPSYVEWCVKVCDGVDFLITEDAITEIKKAFPEFPITADFEYLCQSRFDDFHINEMGYDGDFGDCDDEDDYDTPTYGRYAGSYAQDEMDYSDDDIDTIFDGDPSAYWNID